MDCILNQWEEWPNVLDYVADLLSFCNEADDKPSLGEVAVMFYYDQEEINAMYPYVDQWVEP